MLKIYSSPDNFESLEKFRSMVEVLEQLIEQGDGKAARELAIILDDHGGTNPNAPSDIIEFVEAKFSGERDERYVQAFNLLLEEAKKGDGESMYLIALHYQAGNPPVNYDFDDFVKWHEKAFAAGYIPAASNLYGFYSNPRSKFFDLQKAQHCSEALDAAWKEYKDKEADK